jgi:hypothetical protein
MVFGCLPQDDLELRINRGLRPCIAVEWRSTASQLPFFTFIVYIVCYENTWQRMEEHYPEILRRYMGAERDGGLEYFDKTTKEAADICGASQGSSDEAKGTEPVNRKERAEYGEQIRPLEEGALKEYVCSKIFGSAKSNF